MVSPSLSSAAVLLVASGVGLGSWSSYWWYRLVGGPVALTAVPVVVSQAPSAELKLGWVTSILTWVVLLLVGFIFGAAVGLRLKSGRGAISQEVTIVQNEQSGGASSHRRRHGSGILEKPPARA